MKVSSVQARASSVVSEAVKKDVDKSDNVKSSCISSVNELSLSQQGLSVSQKIKQGSSVGVKSLVAGSFAGATEVLSTNWTEVIKTMRQHHYPFQRSNILSQSVELVQKQGVRSLFRGVVPPLLNSMPYCGVMFASNESLQYVFTKGNLKEKTFLTSLAAGSLSGIPEALISNAADVLRVQMQVPNSPYKTSLSACRGVIQNYGVSGFASGLNALTLRCMMGNGTFFGMKYLTESYMPDQWPWALKTFGPGCVSGMVTMVANTPFDVVNTRLKSIGEKQGVVRILKEIVKAEGFTGLWKGLVPRLYRAGPGGAIMVCAYNSFSTFLEVE